MHDPMVVAFSIRRPWPRRSGPPLKAGEPKWHWAIHRKHGSDYEGRNPRQWWVPGAWSCFFNAFGRRWYFPSVITIWHVEPGGHDSGEICRHSYRWQDSRGKWHSKPLRAWRWHVHHWKVQVVPLQALHRWLFQRCAWCGGPSRKKNPVNVSHSWDGSKGKHWWQGSPGLFHSGCSSAHNVAGSCLCDAPMPDGWNGFYGTCATCGKSYKGEASWVAHHKAIELAGGAEAGASLEVAQRGRFSGDQEGS